MKRAYSFESEFSLGIGETQPELLSNADFVVQDAEGQLEQGFAEIRDEHEKLVSLESLRNRIVKHNGVSVGIALECLSVDSTMALPPMHSYSNRITSQGQGITLQAIDASMEGIMDKIKQIFRRIKDAIQAMFTSHKAVAAELADSLADTLKKLKEKGAGNVVECRITDSDIGAAFSGIKGGLLEAIADLNDFYSCVYDRLIFKNQVLDVIFDSPDKFDFRTAMCAYANPNWEAYGVGFKISTGRNKTELVTFEPMIGGLIMEYNTGIDKVNKTCDIRGTRVDSRINKAAPMKTDTVVSINVEKLDMYIDNLHLFAKNLGVSKKQRDWAKSFYIYAHGVELLRSSEDATSSAGYFLTDISANAHQSFYAEPKLIHAHFIKVMRAFIRTLKTAL